MGNSLEKAFIINNDDICDKFLLALESASKADINHFVNNYKNNKQPKHEIDIDSIITDYVSLGNVERLTKLMPILPNEFIGGYVHIAIQQKQLKSVHFFHYYYKNYMEPDLLNNGMRSYYNSITKEMFETLYNYGANDIEILFKLSAKYDKIDIIEQLKDKILKKEHIDFYYWSAVYGNIGVMKLLKTWELKNYEHVVEKLLTNPAPINNMKISKEALDLCRSWGLTIDYRRIFLLTAKAKCLEGMRILYEWSYINKFTVNWTLNELFYNEIDDSYLDTVKLLREFGATEIEYIFFSGRNIRDIYQYMDEWEGSQERVLVSSTDELDSKVKLHAEEIMTSYITEEIKTTDADYETICGMITWYEARF